MPTRREFLERAGRVGLGAAAMGLGGRRGGWASGERKPNVILFLGDDLGSSQLGCCGEKKIRTPSIDRLAASGVRFTQAYSGSPVCAPSRCVLLTGYHSGHAHIRDNREIQPEGQAPIPTSTVTLAELLKAEGYATALVGKWGLGYPGSEGEPNKQGFDLFFGYNCQRHAHNHYPTYLRRNGEKIALDGNDGGVTGRSYAPDLIEAEALNFIRARRTEPFFLFFATTIPHLALQVPEDSLAEYRGLWPETPYDGKKGYLPNAAPRATYAAMVTRFDRSVGRILALVAELGLEKDTLVLFSSDNGATYDVGGYDMDFFRGNGPFRMHKGYVYEGGIRVPLIVRWTGRVREGWTSDHVCAFQDIVPTVLEAVGAPGRVPKGLDGASFAPVFLERGAPARREFLYMEFPAYGGQQMVRMGRWKGVRQDLLKDAEAPVELYDLEADIGETKDVAAAHPDVVAKIREVMRAERRPSKEFPFPALDATR
ncbi:MAG: arylsulfatase [Candidatus Aminicenantes bacterium]|nr:arylsulfatase [Candidatus Aminicenantes bacterium]